MKIIGITGEIASGKNLLTHLINYNFKCKVFDADKIVHSLYSSDHEVINEIYNIIPESVSSLGINRKILLLKILNDYGILYKIEKIVHPVLIEILSKFIKNCRKNKIQFIILNIPLLFKINADVFCDKIMLISTNKVVQKNRLRRRYGNTKDFIQKDRKEASALKLNIHKRNQGNKIINLKSGIEKFNLLKQFIVATKSL